MTQRDKTLGAAMAFDYWPEPDRQLWQAALQSASLFTDPGGGAHWRPATREGLRACYGRWLAFLARRSWLLSNRGPAERISRDRVVAYAEELQLRLKPVSVWSTINNLYIVSRGMLPDEDWDWLRQLANRLHLKVPKGTVSPDKLLPIEMLYQGGLDLMATDGNRPTNQKLQESIDYRDGLAITLLATTLLRIVNFANLRLDHNLFRGPESYQLRIAPQEVKNRQAIELVLPDVLSGYLDLYLDQHRPLLLQGNNSDLLWIATTGRPFDAPHLSARIAKVTRRLFGKSISAHRFRHCAATSIATDSPELARIIRPLLAHTNNRTGEAYYNRARMMQASRRHGDALADLRQQLSEAEEI